LKTKKEYLLVFEGLQNKIKSNKLLLDNEFIIENNLANINQIWKKYFEEKLIYLENAIKYVSESAVQIMFQ